MSRKFKSYEQGQIQLLPPSLDELIEPGHLSRTINSLIDELDHTSVYESFPGGGTPSYHPVMMLKVLIYAYCTKTFSSREIERNIKQDVVYMWLAGMQRPNHNTINRFRSDYLSDILDEVFFQVVLILKDKGYIKLDNLFVDGTKLEANAGRYTYVWRKNTERYEAGVREKISLLLEEINQINAQEDLELGTQASEELTIGNTISSTELKNVANQLNESIKKKSKSKQTAKKLAKKSKALEQSAEKLEKYEKQKEKLKNRNSYSKTDEDATFMRTKDDALRPCYNPLISTNNQFILNVTLSQNAADNTGFKEHVNKLLEWKNGALKPDNYMGDSGFGNEENYEFLDEKEIGKYLKFNTFHYEQSKKFKENIFLPDNMLYDPKQDVYTCPNGCELKPVENSKRETATGYTVHTKIYECEDCSGCEFASKCHKGDGNRKFSKSIKLEDYKIAVRENLNSELGLKLRRQRGPDVETPFGNIKQNMGIRRFRLRGLKKASTEMLWIAFAHNFIKLSKISKKAS